MGRHVRDPIGKKHARNRRVVELVPFPTERVTRNAKQSKGKNKGFTSVARLKCSAVQPHNTNWKRENRRDETHPTSTNRAFPLE